MTPKFSSLLVDARISNQWRKGWKINWVVGKVRTYHGQEKPLLSSQLLRLFQPIICQPFNSQKRYVSNWMEWLDGSGETQNHMRDNTWPQWRGRPYVGLRRKEVWGFRKAWDFNQALLSKLAWWTLSEKNCLCVMLLRAKYKVRSNWLVEPSNSE